MKLYGACWQTLFVKRIRVRARGMNSKWTKNHFECCSTRGLAAKRPVGTQLFFHFSSYPNSITMESDFGGSDTTLSSTSISSNTFLLPQALAEFPSGMWCPRIHARPNDLPSHSSQLPASARSKSPWKKYRSPYRRMPNNASH